jgi:alpha-ketoglutarate-dependent taurine dioxygenase
VLIFPGQHLSAREQVAFARRFGAIEHIVANLDTVPVSNRRRDGTLFADGEGPMQILRGNEGWHTDSSYMPLAAKASVLSAEVVPSHGGETEWADMRAAYEALDEPTRARIGTLSAFHSLRHSQAKIGASDALKKELREHVARKIGKIARPANIVFTPELPKTRSGKIMRRLLRDVSEHRALGDTTTLADPTVVEELQTRAASEAGQGE